MFILDPTEGRLYGDDAPIDLPPRALSLLLLLVERRGRLVTKQEILDAVWPDAVVSEASIKDYVKDLRRALDDDALAPRHIETVRGRGYRYVGDLQLAGAAPADADRPSIAVLPFDAGAEAGADFFATGVAEDLIFALGRYRQLVVVSQGSSFSCRGLDAARASQRLRARWIAGGRLRRDAERLRLTIELVDGATGRQAWAERFERPSVELFGVQDEVVAAIATCLVGQVERADTRRALAAPEDRLSAHELVLKGRHALRGGSRDDVLAARATLERAVARHPTYALAYTWLAETYYTEAGSAWSADPQAAAVRAFELGRHAVQLDDLDSMAHLTMAWGYLCVQRDLELAAAQLALAMEINPNDYYNLCFGAALSLRRGDLPAAIEHGTEALRRSPLAPEACLRSLGYAHYLAGDYELGLDAFSRSSAPDLQIHAGIAACCAMLARPEAAQAAAAHVRAALADAAEALAGDPDRWRELWARSLTLEADELLDPLLDGLARAGLGPPR